MKSTRVLWIAIGILAALPAAAFAFVKPLRVVAPTLMPGIECPSPNICIDNAALLGDARRLYREGYEQAVAAVGPFRSAPRVVFCTTAACADEFGLGRRAAETAGDFGMAVAPRGWKPFYLVHEMIHYRQAESLGNIAVATKPKWLIEGMAYSLSGDPRHPLSKPFEQWRSQFNAWYANVGPQDLWKAAQSAR
ncbi:hypothetical protein [Trinickia sp. Y13]|uniref:hypothetical protein n=1 Tax=Trinickia sp. Y13 TaxID=2917807 RepID=UPI002406F67A|nr:hypothetical protein [Trinickia sp. Y13]MDG0027886.1 hypothetical protein [Trinickia sp. Y13]